MTLCLYLFVNSFKRTAAYRTIVKTVGFSGTIPSPLTQSQMWRQVSIPQQLVSHGPGWQALLIHARQSLGCAVDHLSARHASESKVPISPADVYQALFQDFPHCHQQAWPPQIVVLGSQALRLWKKKGELLVTHWNSIGTRYVTEDSLVSRLCLF